MKKLRRFANDFRETLNRRKNYFKVFKIEPSSQLSDLARDYLLSSDGITTMVNDDLEANNKIMKSYIQEVCGMIDETLLQVKVLEEELNKIEEERAQQSKSGLHVGYSRFEGLLSLMEFQVDAFFKAERMKDQMRQYNETLKEQTEIISRKHGKNAGHMV